MENEKKINVKHVHHRRRKISGDTQTHRHAGRQQGDPISALDIKLTA
jgi:hypothetical protein